MGRPRKSAAATDLVKASNSNTPSARSSATRSTRSRAVVPDSDELAPDCEEDESVNSLTGSTRSRSRLKAVVVNNKPNKVSKVLERSQTSRLSTASSAQTSVFSASANSSENETPLTSAANTPVNSLDRNTGLHSNKRKRRSGLSAMDDEVDDARLALELQAEEFAQGDQHYPIDNDEDLDDDSMDDDDDEDFAVSRRRRSTGLQSKNRSSKTIFEDDSDEDALSDAPSDISDEAPLSKRRKTVGGSRKPAPRRKASKLLSTEDTVGGRNSELEVNDSDEEDGTFTTAPSEAEEDSGAESQASDGEGNTGNAESFRAYGRRVRNGRAKARKARERDKLETAHPEIKTMWRDLEAVPRIATEQAEQPASISRKLKSFQLEGLNWMVKQEQTQWKGGLLGDEMGMGKTIQAVSLIMSDYPQKNPTLVIVPPVALMQWTNEINDYTDGKLKVLVYHGTNAKSKKMSVKELKAFDVIMISYSGLESVYRKETKGWNRADSIVKEDSAIHAIHFHRLILDEAHSIKQRTTGVAKACFALKGTYKWCLSGTPVQNRIGEFFSLVRFLEVQPFANYFCKACKCSSLHWEASADHRCKQCSHRLLDHVSVFNQEILNPIISGESDVIRKEAFRKLRLITDRIMLRRMKRDHTASMELPPKEVVIHNEFFGEIERDFSSSIMSNTARTFDTYVSRGVMLNNYANIFGLIMQMRQVADHPDLLLKKHAETGQNVLVCNICDEPAEDAIKSRCRHDFCRTCVKDYIRTCEASGALPDCPRCHIALAIDLEQPEIEQEEDVVKKSSIINRIKMENWTSSTKIEMLVYDLYKLRSKKQTMKSIVFSQFTSMLQLIEWRLRRAGFNTVMLDGSMSPQQRQKSIEYFMNNTNVEVFLVSLKAGGVALNLTEASRIFIVDPWWNPAAEWQSADRCHRIGQRRPCVITRLCIEDSVESRIVMLQEKKAQMINGTVNNDDVALEKLTPEDMQFLFRGS